MKNIATLIGEAWDFYRSQPVLNSVLLWLIILPMIALNILARLFEPPEGFLELAPLIMTDVETVWPYQGLIQVPDAFLPFVFLLFLALSIVILWGTACVLLVGRRMIQNKAGRTRSSFKAVRREAARYVVTLFLTDILRDIFTIFWGFLLVVPGVIYYIRTFFYRVVIVMEGLGYREALKRSKEVVIGRTWTVLWSVLGLTIVIFFPAILLTSLIEGAFTLFDPLLIPMADIINGGFLGIATLVFTLATVSLYGELLQQRSEVRSPMS